MTLHMSIAVYCQFSFYGEKMNCSEKFDIRFFLLSRRISTKNILIVNTLNRGIGANCMYIHFPQRQVGIHSNRIVNESIDARVARWFRLCAQKCMNECKWSSAWLGGRHIRKRDEEFLKFSSLAFFFPHRSHMRLIGCFQSSMVNRLKGFFWEQVAKRRQDEGGHQNVKNIEIHSN